jgi:hypothetical protein
MDGSAGVTALFRGRWAVATVAVVMIAIVSAGAAPSTVYGSARSGTPRPIIRMVIDASAGRLMDARRSQLAQHDVRSQRVASWAWQMSLPSNRLVLIYGSPGGMGLLGTLSDSALIARVRAQAATYQRLDPSHPVVPGLDLVTPVAQPVPMGDRSWTARASDAVIQRYLALAQANHFLFFFDMQVGLSTVGRELDRLMPYLVDPGVELALDPEFDMRAGGTPGRRYGQMSAGEINLAIDRLADLVDSLDLPPKVLIVHQFLDSMLPDRSNIHVRPEVSVILCVDGFGPPGSKIDDYKRFNNPTLQYPGFKLFYRQDRPLMSEAQVLGLHPAPVMVMYQ